MSVVAQVLLLVYVCKIKYRNGFIHLNVVWVQQAKESILTHSAVLQEKEEEIERLKKEVGSPFHRANWPVTFMDVC